MYGLRLTRSTRGSLSVYVVGGMIGTIYFGFMASMAAATGIFHPYALGMASGVGAGILMASGNCSALTGGAVRPTADQIAALASASETISGIDGIYMAIFHRRPAVQLAVQRSWSRSLAAEATRTQAKPTHNIWRNKSV